MTDPTTDRLYRHSAWATDRTIAHLQSLPASVLTLTTPGGYGTVGATIAHLVGSQDFYIARLEGGPLPAPRPAATAPADLAVLRADAAASIERLRQLAARDDAGSSQTFDFGEEQASIPRSTVLAQVIHHATEHRTHIFATLGVHGHATLNLDDLDCWAHQEAEAAGTA